MSADRKYRHASNATQAGFTSMPNAVLRRTDLSGLAKIAYALLKDFAWQEIEPEVPDVAALMGIGEKACRGYLKELVDAGLVTSKRRGQGRTNAYIIHDPDAPTGRKEENKTGRFDRSRSPDTTVPRASASEREEDLELRHVPNGTTPLSPRSPRPPTVRMIDGRNVTFDALRDTTNADERAEGGRLASALKTIRLLWADQNPPEPELEGAPTPPSAEWEVGLASEIHRRARLYRDRWPDVELTPTALARNWARVTTPAPSGKRERREDAKAAARAEEQRMRSGAR